MEEKGNEPFWFWNVFYTRLRLGICYLRLPFMNFFWLYPLFNFNTMKLKFELLFEWASAWFLHLTEIYKAVISVGLIVLGAFIAGARDFSFDAYGYAVVFMSNIATAIYLATISRIGCIPILSLSHISEIRNFTTSFFSLHFFVYNL